MRAERARRAAAVEVLMRETEALEFLATLCTIKCATTGEGTTYHQTHAEAAGAAKTPPPPKRARTQQHKNKECVRKNTRRCLSSLLVSRNGLSHLEASLLQEIVRRVLDASNLAGLFGRLLSILFVMETL